MFGGNHGNRGKHLEKVVQLFSHLPDKEDQKDGGADEAQEDKSAPAGEAGKVDLGLSNKPMPAHQSGALPSHMQKKRF
jgi:hypothetical protein